MNTKTKTASNTATHGKARTVIYCHGIFDKPAEDILREQWDRALFGVGQGERTRMAYWVDRSRYPESRVRTRDVAALGRTDELDTETAIPPSGADDVLQESIDSSDSPKKSEAFAHDLENELAVAAVEEAAHAPANLQRPSVRAVGPKGILTPVTSVFTKLFLADVNDFLFNKDRRNRMLDSVKSRVETGGGPFVVIGHSQGSMVVYQALMELGRHVEVELLVTLGSPLGLASVTGELKKWHQGKLPIPSGVKRWIIKAIDHIVSENEKARRLVVHGVNLSLGGPFDAASFGCGDSPLCASLSRLIGQGVVVVIAAGNEGIGRVTVDGFVTDLSLDLSIGDPANLEEAIAVGSVHPTRPHRYGTSYFSSRGPTADGRAKPDVVAPGERIQSCRSGGRGKKLENLYLEMSGTSMAAPHVSGLIAAFLSARPEFIGHPGRVKEILLSHCTDLRRDRYHQGAGLPNLTKMLLET